ncbi:adenylate/guanylate cyclase domain-containing protein [Luteibacter jiangsuensis]
MALSDELKASVASIFKEAWDADRIGRTVPQPEDLRLDANHGINIDATVLYADMADSTGLVDQKKTWFAAEIYKAYMHVAAKLVRANGGQITAYDGDRIMAIFMGDSQGSQAVRCARQIHWALFHVVHSSLDAQYGAGTYAPWHTIGIDRGALLAARIGIRGGNDIVWVGSPANHAAKLCALRYPHAIRITQAVLDILDPSLSLVGQTFIWEVALNASPSGSHVWRTNWNLPS